jgi:hypothetical protein
MSEKWEATNQIVDTDAWFTDGVKSGDEIGYKFVITNVLDDSTITVRAMTKTEQLIKLAKRLWEWGLGKL